MKYTSSKPSHATQNYSIQFLFKGRPFQPSSPRVNGEPKPNSLDLIWDAPDDGGSPIISRCFAHFDCLVDESSLLLWNTRKRFQIFVVFLSLRNQAFWVWSGFYLLVFCYFRCRDNSLSDGMMFLHLSLKIH